VRSEWRRVGVGPERRERWRDLIAFEKEKEGAAAKQQGEDRLGLGF
jgi:hypothetical protein